LVETRLAASHAADGDEASRACTSTFIAHSYFATKPAGCAELVTLVALLNAPFVVLTSKPEMLLDALLDT